MLGEIHDRVHRIVDRDVRVVVESGAEVARVEGVISALHLPHVVCGSPVGGVGVEETSRTDFCGNVRGLIIERI